MSGSAKPGLDYTLSSNVGQLVLGAGKRTATVTLTALTNNVKAVSGRNGHNDIAGRIGLQEQRSFDNRHD
jgi:hypothetical protein